MSDIFDAFVEPSDKEINSTKPNSQIFESSSSQFTQDSIFYFSERVQNRDLSEIMGTSYLSYAMSVIVSRALPDVRDGLKPVHRRIIYAMNKLGLGPGAKYRKSAQVVGEVLGKYHPHGDASVYDSLVRLAQDFSMRYPLIDGQGNFGSLDGDPPAAMRYTEARMAKACVFMIEDIDKETVDFVDNYDGTQKEPTVLPNLLPNLIVNGTNGIAVGMATSIPPHNLGEVCQALLYLIRNPQAEVRDLLNFIKGPDLPTGGSIYGRANLLEAYQTGRGKCVVRAKTLIEDNKIVVTEIPYQVNKSSLVQQIADLVKEKKIEGIKDLRDESNKQGVRLVIEAKKDTNLQVLLNNLYKLTALQSTLSFNMVALVNQGRQPKVLNLKEILQEYITHRLEVITRRTKFELNKAKKELHFLDGLKIALDFIDQVVNIIRSSQDKNEASDKLQTQFKLSKQQAEAVLQMKLQTLTNLDKAKIETERTNLNRLVQSLQTILDDPQAKTDLLCQEITTLKDKFADSRRTTIFETDADTYDKEDLIEEEKVLVQLTKEQYLKVMPIGVLRQQSRGGKGVSSFDTKDEDWIKSSFICNSHDFVYAFTNTGRVFRTRVFDLPIGSRTGRGQNLVNYLNLQENEKITNILTIPKAVELERKGELVFATQKGLVKRTSLAKYVNIRKNGIVAITLQDGDQLIGVEFSGNSSDHLVLSADNGKTVIFAKSEVRCVGRNSRGVLGIKLQPGDKVISLQITSFDFAQSEQEEV